jgi:minor extracellular serine protease Vpr
VIAGTPAITIPVVAITKADGDLIDSRLASGPVTMTWTDQVESFPNTATGGLISSFSSYGPTADLQVKPDIGAPGGSIYSTYPLELGGFANISGTSMAAPHVAGAAALLLEAEPHIKAEEVRGRLQNSADPKAWWGNPALGFLDNVHRQGAGMLDIDDAITADTTVTPAKIALGESEFGPVTRRLTIANESHQPVTYMLSHAPALSTGPNTFAVSFNTGFATAAFSSPVVTIKGRHRASVDVTITANPALADKSVYGGYIVLTPQGGGQVYRVPYAGFKGDYQSIQVLVPTAAGYPWLAKLVEDDLVNQDDGTGTFTMEDDDVPYFVVHLDHQSRRLRLKITHVATGLSWFRALQEDYLPRNSTPTGFFVLPWDGTITIGGRAIPVPNGQYQMTMTVLKALGDESNPAHVETWESPTFTITRAP